MLMKQNVLYLTRHIHGGRFSTNSHSERKQLNLDVSTTGSFPDPAESKIGLNVNVNGAMVMKLIQQCVLSNSSISSVNSTLWIQLGGEERI